MYKNISSSDSQEMPHHETQSSRNTKRRRDIWDKQQIMAPHMRPQTQDKEEPRQRTTLELAGGKLLSGRMGAGGGAGGGWGGAGGGVGGRRRRCFKQFDLLARNLIRKWCSSTFKIWVLYFICETLQWHSYNHIYKLNKWTKNLIQADPHQVLNIKGKDRTNTNKNH